MIDHISTYTTEFDNSQNFYKQILATLGYVMVTEMVASWDEAFPTRRICAFGQDKPTLWLIEVKPEQAATPRHMAFVAADKQAVDEFHAKALALGAKDNGAPGPRPHYHEGFYGGFVIDPDGNNIEAVFHGAN